MSLSCESKRTLPFVVKHGHKLLRGCERRLTWHAFRLPSIVVREGGKPCKASVVSGYVNTTQR